MTIAPRSLSRSRYRKRPSAKRCSNKPRRALLLESLEDRRLLALTVVYDPATDVLSLTETSHASDTVQISQTLTAVTVSVGAGNSFAGGSTDAALTYNGATPETSDSVSIDVSDLRALSIQTGTMGDSLTISSLDASSVDVTLDGESDSDTIAINPVNNAGSLTTGNAAISLVGTINTSGSQTYNDAVELGADTTLTSSGAGTIQFASTVDGPHNLSVNTTGTTQFDAAVGGTTALTSLTTDAGGTTRINGGAVTTTGDQTYDDAVVLGATTTLSAHNVTFHSTVDAATAGSQGLTVNSSGGGVTTLGDAAADRVGGTAGLAFLTTNADGTTRINTDQINTSGSQTYNDAVELGADTTLTSSGAGTIQFASTVDGPHNLSVNTTGTTQFDAAVGGTTALTSLTTDAGGTTQINAGAVTTTGDQTYDDAVVLGNTTTLSAHNVTFHSTVDAATAGSQGLTVNSSGGGVTTLGDAAADRVGGTAGLAFLTTNADGTTRINTDQINTSGSQTYNDAVELGADTTLTSSGAGTIQFASTVDGPHNLSVNTTGTTQFDAAVGGTTALTSLTTDAGGTTQINAGAVTTTGDQTYGDAVVLGNTTTLSAHNVTFHSTVDAATAGSQGLTINSSGGGVTTFGDAAADRVGGTAGLAFLTTNADGTTRINTDQVNTSGSQTYNDAVELGADTTLSSSGAGTIQFTSTVDGAHNLSVNTTGTTQFDAAVGGTTALTSLTTDAGGTTQINAGAVTTTGDQTYGDAVVLGNTTTLSAHNVTFHSTVDAATAGSQGLTVNSSGGGVTTLGDAAADRVGGTAGLAFLTTNADGTTQINADQINTSGSQTYNDAVELGADTTLSSSGAGTIQFTSTVDGPHNLSVNTTGTTQFDAAVGGTTALTSLTTDAGGTTQINAGAVTTTGDQTYGDAVVLGNTTTLSAHNVTFHSTVDAATAGSQGLMVNSSGGGVITLGDAAADRVGGSASLAFLTTNADGTTRVNTDRVNTSGNQTYEDAVELGADTTLTSSGAGTIQFASTVDGPHSLSINTSGTTQFDAAVGGTTALTSLTTDAGGTTQVNGGAVTTTADQTYNDAVVLGATTTLSAHNVTFNSTVDAATAGSQGLTVNSSGGGVTTLGDAAADRVGGTAGLAFLTTNADGTTQINADQVNTSGSQTYNDAVELGADTTLTSSGAGTIQFALTLDGPHNLSVNTSGTTQFAAAVGGSTPLTSLTTDAGGTTQINGGAVTTTGDQTYGDAVVLGATTTLSAHNVTFHSTVDAATADIQGLTVNSSGGGVTTFGDAAADRVGGTARLAFLITNADGTTQINTDQVNTAGSQTYNDAMELGGDTTLSSSGAGTIQFALTVDGAHNLSVNTSGTTQFDAAVGGTTALTSLATDAGGTTQINGGAVTTTGDQTYGDAVVLGATTTLSAHNVTFNNTVDAAMAGSQGLTINTTDIGADVGTVTFVQDAGSSQALTYLAVNASGPFVFSVRLTTTEDISIVVRENADSGNDDSITIQGTATITNRASDVDEVGNIVLDAGDNVTIADGATVIAADSMRIVGDRASNDLSGTTIDIRGVNGEVTAGARVDVVGGPDNDVFNLQLARLPGVNYFVDGAGHSATRENSVLVPGVAPGLTSPGPTYSVATMPVTPTPSFDSPTGDVLNTIDTDQTTSNDYLIDGRLDNTGVIRDGGPAVFIVNDGSVSKLSSIETLNLSIGADADNIVVEMPDAGSTDLPSFVNLDGGSSSVVDHLFIVGTDRTDRGENIVINEVPTASLPLGTGPAGQGGAGPIAIANIEALNINAEQGSDVIANYTDAISLIRTMGSETTGGNDIVVSSATRNALDVVFAAGGLDAIFGGGGNDYLFADTEATNVQQGSESFRVYIRGGERIDGGSGVNAISATGTSVVDIPTSFRVLAGTAVELSVLDWLRAQFLPSGSPEAIALPEEALDAYRAAGGSTEVPTIHAMGLAGGGGEAFALHNVANPVDVNADGRISPLDALLVINELNSNGGYQVGGNRSVGEGEAHSRYYFDTNSDNLVSPIDALLVITHLNRGEGEAEGERQGQFSPLASGGTVTSGFVTPHAGSVLPPPSAPPVAIDNESAAIGGYAAEQAVVASLKAKSYEVGNYSAPWIHPMDLPRFTPFDVDEVDEAIEHMFDDSADDELLEELAELWE